MDAKYKLLLVDDEENILNALVRVFRGEEDFEIIMAHNAQDAQQKIAHTSIDIVISDQRMPGMGGAELLKVIRDMYPDSIRFLLSGYADVEAIITAINEGDIYRFIKKPWNNDELKALVKKSIGQRDITRIISETVFRAKRTLEINKDIEMAISSDGKGLTLKMKDSSRVIPPESLLRLVDFIIGAVESEGKLNEGEFHFSGGTINKQGGKIALVVDMGKDISLNIEFPSSA